jgi:hypothetical protein
VVSFTLQLLYPREKAPGNHWIGDWVELRTSLNAVQKRKISFTLPVMQFHFLNRLDNLLTELPWLYVNFNSVDVFVIQLRCVNYNQVTIKQSIGSTTRISPHHASVPPP